MDSVHRMYTYSVLAGLPPIRLATRDEVPIVAVKMQKVGFIIDLIS